MLKIKIFTFYVPRVMYRILSILFSFHCMVSLFFTLRIYFISSLSSGLIEKLTLFSPYRVNGNKNLLVTQSNTVLDYTLLSTDPLDELFCYFNFVCIIRISMRAEFEVDHSSKLLYDCT